MAEEIKLDFTGDTQDLRQGLEETRSLLIDVRKEVKTMNDAMATQASAGAESTEKLNKALKSSVDTMAALEKSGVGSLSKDLDKAAASAQKLETSAKSSAESIEDAFSTLVTEARAAAKEQGVVVKGLDKQSAAAIGLLRTLGALTDKEAELAKEAAAIVSAFEAQAKASESAAASGTKFLIQEEERLLTSQEVLKHQERQQQLNMEAAKAATLVASAEGKAAMEREKAAQAAARYEADRKGLLQDIAAEIKNLQKEQAAAKDEETLIRVNRQLAEAQENLKDLQKLGLPPMEEGVKGARGLRTELNLAKKELDQLMQASNGELTPELIQAAKRAGELEDRFTTLNSVVRAFNPTARFQAITNVLGNMAGGFQAATAAAGLFGSESENVNKALLKIQQTTALVQGLQTFFGGLASNMQTLRTVIVATTAAQRAGTAATVTDTGAKAAQATATAAASTATVSLGSAIRGMTAAMLASPLLPIALALAGIGAVITLLIANTRDYAQELKDLNAEMDEFASNASKAGGMDLRMKLLENEAKAIRAGGTEEAKRRKLDEDFLARKKKAQEDLSREELRYQLAQVGFRDREKKLNKEEREEALKAIEERKNAVALADHELKVLNKEYEIDVLKSNDTIAKDNDKKAKERVEKAKRLRDQLIALEEDLAQRIFRAQLDAADPMERARLEKQAADQEVKVLEQKLAKMNQVMKGSSALNEQQQALLRQARLDNEAAYLREVERITAESRAVLLTLEEDANKRAFAQFQADLRARAEELRKAGADELAIEIDAANRLQAFNDANAQKRIDLEERNSIALVQARKKGAESEEEFERSKQEAIIRIQLEYAQKRLVLLQQNTSEEGRVLAAEMAAQIVKLEGELGKVVPQKDRSIWGLLGIKPPTEAEKRAIEQGLMEIVNLADVFVDSQLREVDAAIAATDRIIADRERRGDSLRSQLDQEIELARMGFANNIDLVRQQIAENEAAAEAEKARREQLLQQQQRLAKQQIAIDAAVQASSLAVAAAKVFGAEGAKGVPGIIAAVGVIASMMAAFVSLRARAKAAANQDLDQFGEGGWVDGPSHARGGKVIEAEGGEHVTRKKQAQKYHHVLDGINENKWTKARQAQLNELLHSAGIAVNEKEVDHFVGQKQALVNHNYTASLDTKRMEQRQRETTSEVRALRRQQAETVAETMEGDYRVTRAPGITIRRRK